MIKFLIIIIFLQISVHKLIFSQKLADEYQQPPVIDGMSWTITGHPYLSYTKYSDDSTEDKTYYNIMFGTGFTKWRYSQKVNYFLQANAYGEISKVNDELYNRTQSKDINSSASILEEVGFNYYLNNLLYAGLHYKGAQHFADFTTPLIRGSLSPGIGIGRIVDAYVVNEAVNIENVLKKEGYIKSSFNKRARLLTNHLLDKRNENEFLTKYKDDNEIEFFTQLEKLLFDEKVIDRPLNARTTMKIYQTLNNNSFVLFPVYKGWQFNAELELKHSNTIDDTTTQPIALNLSGVLGLPLNNRSSFLLSAALAFPINKNYSNSNYRFENHSPVILRTLQREYYNNNYITSESFYFSNYYNIIYSLKAFGQAYFFHNFNPTVGLSAGGIITAGKWRNQNCYNLKLRGDVNINYSVLNKLYIKSGIYFGALDDYDYSISFTTQIGYYIF